MSRRNIILSLCDYSGVWASPYRVAGYHIIQVDLKLGGDAKLFPSGRSIARARYPREFVDIRDFIGEVHGILAAPVCTVFSGAGAKHPRTDDEIREGLSLVDACIRLDWVLKPDFFCLENPVGKLSKWLGEPLMRFNPNDFGENYTKRTCLYGRFNTNLKYNKVAATEGSKMWKKYGGKSERTKELRSVTPMGFATAFYEANP